MRLLAEFVCMTEAPVGKHLNLLLQTDFIIAEAEKFILQRKAEIYQSLAASIQNDLLLCYEGMPSHLGFFLFVPGGFDFHRITPVRAQKQGPGLPPTCRKAAKKSTGQKDSLLFGHQLREISEIQSRSCTNRENSFPDLLYFLYFL